MKTIETHKSGFTENYVAKFNDGSFLLGIGDTENQAKFMLLYRFHLAACLKEFPQDYTWPESQIEVVVCRMQKAIAAKTYNKDSHAFKRTCRDLGIKHTYTEINNYWNAQ